MTETVIVFTAEGRKIRFVLDNLNDSIQKVLFSGEFYESLELLDLRTVIPLRSVVLDIGANIGNHTVFFASCTNADVVIPFEPNPRAFKLLKENVRINQLSRVNLSYLGFGLGAREEAREIEDLQANNLGGARLKRVAEGGTVVKSLDDCAISVDHIDFIKIDVEGMELEVLKGAKNVIEKYRPIMYVEVNNFNRNEFISWCDMNAYRIERTHCRYRNLFNYLIFPHP